MRRVFNLPGLLFLLGWTTHLQAQTASSSVVIPPLPWYISAQLADHAFEIVVPGQAPGLTGVQPYQITVGRYLTSRWAVQVSYSAYSFLDERTAYGTTITGEPTSSYTHAELRSKAVSLLLRHRLTRKVAHRMQFDGLLGTTLVTYRDKFNTSGTTNGQVVRQNSWASQATNLYLTLGPAASYRFNRHLEACFDFLLTKNLHSIDQTFSKQQLNSTFGFQRGFNLGLRYRFNLGKKTPVE